MNCVASIQIRAHFGLVSSLAAVASAKRGLVSAMAVAEDERILTTIGGNQEQNIRTKEVEIKLQLASLY